MKEYRLKNKDRIKEQMKNYRIVNHEHLAEMNRQGNKRRYYQNPKLNMENSRKWKLNNGDKVRAWYRKYNSIRYNSDPQYKAKNIIRSRFRMALKHGYKSGSAIEYLGCSIESFIQYIESKFVEGMSWENWALDGWHLDHIVPLEKFDLTNKDEARIACHYTNLQPLWAKDNLSKRFK